MSIETWLAYIATVLILMSTPGPSQLLLLSNSLQYGFKRSLFTGAGDLSANFLQMLAASLGLVSVIASSQELLSVIKWAGVGYLVYLGLRQMFASSKNTTTGTQALRWNRALYWQGFMTSAANPKAVIFFAALFPQFIDPEHDLAFQFAVLSATYLFLDATFLTCYGRFAQWFKTKMLHANNARLNMLSGGLLVFAAMLLGLKDISVKP